MVDWLAGKRVRGTSSERTPLGTAVGGTGVGGWVELGRTTLGGTADTISVSSLADKRYYMLLYDDIDTGGNTNIWTRLNGDTGTNYSSRESQNGGADSTATSEAQMRNGSVSDVNAFGVAYLANLSANEKLYMSHVVENETAGAATAPDRAESVGKWANTSNAVNAISINNNQAGSYNTGSEVVVLGWDPDDTHTNNFWEELADVDLSGGASADLSSGTITAKKYLWIQIYIDSMSAGRNAWLEFNSDTGNNYAHRYSTDGSADSTATSQPANIIDAGGVTTPRFINVFMINNQSNEKLGISHAVKQSTAGAANAPSRSEQVIKWANTSNQITDINLTTTDATTMGTGTVMKVWGAD